MARSNTPSNVDSLDAVTAAYADLQRTIARTRAAALAKVRDLIRTYGFKASDLEGDDRAPVAAEVRPPRKVAKPAAKPASAKYQDPATGAQWSGMGRKPKWVLAVLDAGGSLSDLTVAKVPAAATVKELPPASKGKAAPGSKAKAAAKPAKVAAPTKKAAKTKVLKPLTKSAGKRTASKAATAKKAQEKASVKKSVSTSKAKGRAKKLDGEQRPAGTLSLVATKTGVQA